MKTEDKERIDRESSCYAQGFPTNGFRLRMAGYVAGAVAEHERMAEQLKHERNKYDDLMNSIQRHFQTLIARNYNNIGEWSNERQDYNFQLIGELEELLKKHNSKILTAHEEH